MKKSGFRLLAVLMCISGCSGDPAQKESQDVTLTLGAYTVPKDAYQKEIIPAFQKYWKGKTGLTVVFQESYEASGAQGRAIAAGFEADIAALSLEEDIEVVRRAGLITHDWKNGKAGGFVTRSTVAIAYRPGNPKNIKDWDDLKREDVAVLYPSPKTSGGAMWDVNAIYGAGLKLTEVKNGTPDKAYAHDLLKAIQRRVKVMDKSGRESVGTFENGIGDALVTYENEALLRQKQGKNFPFVVPPATILIENPVALVDVYADKHGNRKVAEAFGEFLFQKEAQRSFARYGFRSIDGEVAQEFAAKYPVPQYLFDMKYLGGWPAVQKELYGPEGVWTKIIQELANEGK
jgi:sulfate/thiosulfate transport system substrate-binding protein